VQCAAYGGFLSQSVSSLVLWEFSPLDRYLNRSHIIATAFAWAVIVTGMLPLWYPLVGDAADAATPDTAAQAVVQVLEQAGLGKVTVRVPGDAPKGLVLLFTGTQEQDTQTTALASDIAELDYVVASIDSNASLFQKMGSTAGASDAIARLLQFSTTLEARHQWSGKRPLLVGYGGSAKLVYDILTTAAPKTFHAGISLDFCPSADPIASTEPTPVAHLATTWFVFQRAPACDAEGAARFVQAVGNARLDNSIPAATENTDSQQPWNSALSILQWLDPAIVDQLQADEKTTGVPLVDIPAENYKAGGRMVVFLSGDGGWAELDAAVSAQLSQLGFAVVGWDSLSYFWNAKTPEQASGDLERVLRHYQQLWQPGKISLVGYSFGANVLPFMASRLPADLRAQIDRIVLLNPEARASFEFHVSNWITSPTENTVPLQPEVAKLRWSNVLCLYGDEEESTDVCPSFAGQGVSVASLPGDHHFDEDYPKLAERIVKDWPTAR
jgi:type IV secretory pathway VirJ component